jgi:hypothetical protein
MRGKFDNYVGHFDLAGKSVIDVGPRPTFSRSSREVRCSSRLFRCRQHRTRYTRLLHAGSLYSRDPAAAIRIDNKWLDGVKRSYWYVHRPLCVHRAFDSKNCVVSGNVHDLPPGFIGAFDVAILGQFLVHNRSGIDVLEAVARTTKDAMIITEGVWPVKEPGAKSVAPHGHHPVRAARPDDFYSTGFIPRPFMK